MLDRRARLIRLIHVAKGQLKLDDETYRALLEREGGQRSTTRMGVAQLETVLARMRTAGFKVKTPKKAGSKRISWDMQSRKIRALWMDLHARGIVRSADEASLQAFVKRMTRKDSLEWLSDADAAVVIEQLKKWGARHAAKSAGDVGDDG